MRLLGRPVELHREGLRLRRSQPRYLELPAEYAADHGIIDYLAVVHHRQSMAEVLARGTEHGGRTACIQANVDYRTLLRRVDAHMRESKLGIVAPDTL